MLQFCYRWKIYCGTTTTKSVDTTQSN